MERGGCGGCGQMGGDMGGWEVGWAGGVCGLGFS